MRCDIALRESDDAVAGSDARPGRVGYAGVGGFVGGWAVGC